MSLIWEAMHLLLNIDIKYHLTSCYWTCWRHVYFVGQNVTIHLRICIIKVCVVWYYLKVFWWETFDVTMEYNRVIFIPSILLVMWHMGAAIALLLCVGSVLAINRMHKVELNRKFKSVKVYMQTIKTEGLILIPLGISSRQNSVELLEGRRYNIKLISTDRKRFRIIILLVWNSFRRGYQNVCHFCI